MHWPGEANSSGAEWFRYYNTFVPWTEGPKNGWLYRVNECGGWWTFWREMWLAFGIMWFLAMAAFCKARPLYKTMFIVLWLGCFAACLVSHDKMRLWFRMSPVLIPMVIAFFAGLKAIDKKRL